MRRSAKNWIRVELKAPNEETESARNPPWRTTLNQAAVFSPLDKGIEAISVRGRVLPQLLRSDQWDRALARPTTSCLKYKRKVSCCLSVNS